MKISASLLAIRNNIVEEVKKLEKENIPFFHLDIMDGKFVKNKTWTVRELATILDGTTKIRDMHLMVKDVCKYVDEYLCLKPRIITFHLEAVDDIEKTINYIKKYNIKVGIALNPETNLDLLLPYLKKIDLVLVMTVEPGASGKPFIKRAANKINELKVLRDYNKYHYLIEVDGGLNPKTISYVKKADIFVVGSYLMNTDNYQKNIENLEKVI